MDLHPKYHVDPELEDMMQYKMQLWDDYEMTDHEIMQTGFLACAADEYQSKISTVLQTESSYTQLYDDFTDSNLDAFDHRTKLTRAFENWHNAMGSVHRELNRNFFEC